MRFAVNPLQLYARPDGTLDFAGGPGPEAAAAEAARAGFTAVQADLTAADVAAYARSLAALGLTPAPGYFHAEFESPGLDVVEVERRFEAALDASRFLDAAEIVVACSVTPAGRARAGRARDAAPDMAQVERVAQRVDALGRMARARAVRLCFHQHVGTAIESPAELEALLAATDPQLVFLCQDTGHLAWGGADDLADTLARHRARTGMLHVKDVARAALAEARSMGLDYTATVRAGLWQEPGRGDLGLAELLEPWRDVPLWAVVEVDRPALPDARLSLAASFAFTRSLFRKPEPA